MSTAQQTGRPKPKLALPWWLTALVVSVPLSYLSRYAYRTDNWVLVVAIWAALLTFVIVSYRSFVKRER